MDLSGVKKTDIGVAAYLLAAIIFFIVPDPAFVYDDLSYFPKRFIYPSDPKYGFAGKCR